MSAARAQGLNASRLRRAAEQAESSLSGFRRKPHSAWTEPARRVKSLLSGAPLASQSNPPPRFSHPGTRNAYRPPERRRTLSSVARAQGLNAPAHLMSESHFFHFRRRKWLPAWTERSEVTPLGGAIFLRGKASPRSSGSRNAVPMERADCRSCSADHSARAASHCSTARACLRLMPGCKLHKVYVYFLSNRSRSIDEGGVL